MLNQVVAPHLQEVLEKMDYQDSFQPGFRPGFGMVFNDDFQWEILLDLSVSFDTINHGILQRCWLA